MGDHLKKVGILGGTFDPIHFGHLNLAFELMEKHGLDEVWFCPAWQNPHKLGSHAVSGTDRLEMVRLAVEDIPVFRVIDVEIKRGGPSYMVDTLKGLTDNNPAIKFFLILGEDAALQFPEWKSPQEITLLCEVLVGSRSLASAAVLPPILKNGLTQIPLLDISSTEIRSRVSKKLYISHLVPPKVVDYIYKNQLY